MDRSARILQFNRRPQHGREFSSYATMPGAMGRPKSSVTASPAGNEPIAVFSARTLITLGDSVSVLKRAAVLFEHLFFDDDELPMGHPGFPDFATPHDLLSMLATRRQEDERPFLANSPAFKSLVLTPSDLFSHERIYFEAVHQASSSMDSTLRSAIMRAAGRHKPAQYKTLTDWWKSQKSMVSAWIGEFARFSVAAEEIPGAIPLCSQFHLEVVHKFDEMPGAASTPTFLELLEANPPVDFSQLAWHDIFDLRGDTRVRQFRRRLAELAIAGRADPSSIGPTAWNDAFSALESLQTSVPRAVVEGVVTNLPFLIPVNPVAAAASIRKVVRAKRIGDRYGWLLFLAEARRRIKRGSSIATEPSGQTRTPST